MYQKLAAQIHKIALRIEKKAEVSLDPQSVKQLVDLAVHHLDRNKIPDALKLLREIQKELTKVKGG